MGVLTSILLIRFGPFILTRLFQSYCLSLYVSSLWTLSCPTLQNIEVAFNKILCRIWSPPACSHTRIEPFSMTLPSPAYRFVVTTTCLVIVILSNILLRTIFVL